MRESSAWSGRHTRRQRAVRSPRFTKPAFGGDEYRIRDSKSSALAGRCTKLTHTIAALAPNTFTHSSDVRRNPPPARVSRPGGSARDGSWG